MHALGVHAAKRRLAAGDPETEETQRVAMAIVRVVGEKVNTGRQLARQDGSALLEVLIAGIILGTAFVGLASMFSFSRAMVVAQGDGYVALYLAQQKMEDCVARGLDAPRGLPNEIITGGESGVQTFRRDTTVITLDASTKRVSVTVTPLSMIETSPVTLVTEIKNAS